MKRRGLCTAGEAAGRAFAKALRPTPIVNCRSVQYKTPQLGGKAAAIVSRLGRPRSIRRARDLTAVLPGAMLVAVVASVYWPSPGGAFTWDDDRHVFNNPSLRGWHGLGAIQTEIGAVPQYYPLVHTSFWVEWRFWGDNPAGYRLTNVLLHAAAGLVPWRILRRLGVIGAFAAAAGVGAASVASGVGRLGE